MGRTTGAAVRINEATARLYSLLIEYVCEGDCALQGELAEVALAHDRDQLDSTGLHV